jgi:hypothetical protein
VKPLIRLLIVALVAAAGATVIVQRERLREIDREQLAAQIREAIETRFSRGDRTIELPAVEDAEMELDAPVEQVEEAAEDLKAAAEDASS